MVILRTRNKITDFFMILAWASPFKYTTGFKRQSPFYFDRQLDYITRINIRWDIYIALQSLQDTGQETMDQSSRSAK